jgi:UDP-galactopyranose mutase
VGEGTKGKAEEEGWGYIYKKENQINCKDLRSSSQHIFYCAIIDISFKEMFMILPFRALDYQAFKCRIATTFKWFRRL